jgi:hypothetical protein
VIKQTREGWLGKPKGMKQIRGLWNSEMKKHESDHEKEKKRLDGKTLLPEHLDMVRVLSKLPDFKGTKCALRKMIEDRGHILMISPKCHPEIAGNGIESAWGFSSSKIIWPYIISFKMSMRNRKIPLKRLKALVNS